MAPPNDYQVNIDVSIRNYHQGGGDLRLSENITISECTFDDMAGILKGFHELAEALKAAKARASTSIIEAMLNG